MRSGCLTVVLLLSACQPQARRLLVLDLALSEPALLNGTVQPWRDEGYHVEYRRFYPHLARADLDRYRVLLFLLGREPEAPSDAITAGDLALLTEWVLRGGVAVLGYDADGEGYLDRWTANRWLEFLGTGISIGDRLLEDTTVRALTTTGRSQPWVEARTVGDEPLGSPLGEVYEAFPLDRNNVVTVRDHAALLAVTSPHAFVRAPRPPRTPSPRGASGVVAAARVGDGLVLVISRHALGALGPRPPTGPTWCGREPRSIRSSRCSTSAASISWAATPTPRGRTRCTRAGRNAMPCGVPGPPPWAGSSRPASRGYPCSITGTHAALPPTRHAGHEARGSPRRAHSIRCSGRRGSPARTAPSAGWPRSSARWSSPSAWTSTARAATRWARSSATRRGGAGSPGSAPGRGWTRCPPGPATGRCGGPACCRATTAPSRTRSPRGRRPCATGS